MSTSNYEQSSSEPLNMDTTRAADVEKGSDDQHPRQTDYRELAVCSIICGLSCCGIMSLIYSVKVKHTLHWYYTTQGHLITRLLLAQAHVILCASVMAQMMVHCTKYKANSGLTKTGRDFFKKTFLEFLTCQFMFHEMEGVGLVGDIIGVLGHIPRKFRWNVQTFHTPLLKSQF